MQEQEVVVKSEKIVISQQVQELGGVLEPATSKLPTIIEDNVFLGAMSEVVEGVIVGEGSVLSMGMYIGQSTKIVNRNTGEINYGKIPPYSVVVPGIIA